MRIKKIWAESRMRFSPFWIYKVQQGGITSDRKKVIFYAMVKLSFAGNVKEL